jgi:hypothetical protein
MQKNPSGLPETSTIRLGKGLTRFLPEKRAFVSVAGVCRFLFTPEAQRKQRAQRRFQERANVHLTELILILHSFLLRDLLFPLCLCGLKKRV